MNALEMLLNKPLFQALGWALVHFIWQGALVALLYAGLATALRRQLETLSDRTPRRRQQLQRPKRNRHYRRCNEK